jgi:hypothetical protein
MDAIIPKPAEPKSGEKCLIDHADLPPVPLGGQLVMLQPRKGLRRMCLRRHRVFRRRFGCQSDFSSGARSLPWRQFRVAIRSQSEFGRSTVRFAKTRKFSRLPEAPFVAWRALSAARLFYV